MKHLLQAELILHSFFYLTMVLNTKFRQWSESCLTGTITSLSAYTEPQINKAHLQSQSFLLK